MAATGTGSRSSALPSRLSAAVVRADLAPGWVAGLLGPKAARLESRAGPVAICVCESAAFTLVSVRVADAASMDAASFERHTREAYAAVADILGTRPPRHAVRLWNHIPQLKGRGSDGRDRYGAFDAGRRAGGGDLLSRSSLDDTFGPPTSDVGHPGTDLVLHVLGSVQSGVALGATRGSGVSALAVPVGEDGSLRLVGEMRRAREAESPQAEDVRAQTRAALADLETLLNQANAHVGASAPAPRLDVRVYVAREADRPLVAALLDWSFRVPAAVEYAIADLPGPGSLVAIEACMWSPASR